MYGKLPQNSINFMENNMYWVIFSKQRRAAKLLGSTPCDSQ